MGIICLSCIVLKMWATFDCALKYKRFFNHTCFFFLGSQYNNIKFCLMYWNFPLTEYKPINLTILYFFLCQTSSIQFKTINYHTCSMYVYNWSVQSTKTQFLDPYIFVLYGMNFDILRAWNSSPGLEVSYNIEWRSLNYAFSYDVLRARKSYPQLEVHHDVEWGSLNHAIDYDVTLADSGGI